jgi:hypothetical protein
MGLIFKCGLSIASLVASKRIAKLGILLINRLFDEIEEGIKKKD